MQKMYGSLLITVAALLWSTDALIRYPFIQHIDPLLLVLIEHILAVLLLLPFCLKYHPKQLFSLTPVAWFSAVFAGAGGSALGTLFFTASFLFINPSVAVLLQKLQPLFVVLIAYFFLGERPQKKFYFWGLLALGAVVFLSFPGVSLDTLLWIGKQQGHQVHHLKGIEYAVAAALLWAVSTVSGKALLKNTPSGVASFWRFFFGLLTMFFLCHFYTFSENSFNWSLYSTETVLSVLYLSLVPGLFAMVVYYHGLARTPASVVTFVELLYPIGAVILNTLFLNTPLDTVQVIAGSVLVFAVGMISI